MKNSKYNMIPIMFERLKDYTQDDERFTKVRLWLMHLGENYNGSIFEEESTTEAMKTLEYIPIVGFIEENKNGEEDFSNHRYIITKKDGEIVQKYLGRAYGVILSNADNNAHYEDRLCDDGVTRTFVVVDGLIWNRFEESAEILNRDITKSHSMELYEPSCEGYEDENGLFHFTKFSFNGACILGDDYLPAMDSSTIEVQFTMKDFVKSIQSELTNKLNTFSRIIDNVEIQEKGGTKNMAEDTKNLENTEPNENTDFSTTVMQNFQEICNVVRELDTVKDYWGDEVPQYYVNDIQNDEVIVVDTADNYNYYGFKFTMEGDKPVIDKESKTRKKITYADFEEGTTKPEGMFSFAKVISDFENKVTEKINALATEKTNLETECSTIKAEYEDIKPKYEEYQKIEAERIEKETKANKLKVFEKFDEHLMDNEKYIHLKENQKDYSVDEIKAQCAILFTEKNLNTDFTRNDTENEDMSMDIPDDIQDEGIVQTARYGAIRKHN